MVNEMHVVDLLPAYLNQRLDAGDRAHVDAHLRNCAACRAELDTWRAIASATRQLDMVAAPAPDLLSAIHAELDQNEAPRSAIDSGDVRSFRYLWQLLCGQAPLVRRGIWLASGLTTALGVLVSIATLHQSIGSFTLALIAPVVAAFGMAFIYGPENDPSLEIAISTPTSPRLVLLSRLTLVFGYDLLLALVASVALTAVHGFSLWTLIELWFAPMLFLSALTLAASLVFSPLVAMVGALILWGLRLVQMSSTLHQNATQASDMAQAFGLPTLNPYLLVFGLALLVFAVAYVPRQERFNLNETTMLS
ncbi:MAG TPA: zf-HC2 domain-containing protein [Nitrolancea sp.]|nr:zf-HC2 domain-containing protein [Nitrolancea sp.]